jgi:tRNA U34 5-methylaminomethyl-2-thiouridine-forming methyltransferase MnmC
LKLETLNKLIETSDGSHTLYVPEMDEHYHSIHGAVQESTIVFIKNGFDFCKADPVKIFEAGFGTGLNALLTLIRSIKGNRKVHYTSIEKFPLPAEITSLLNHYSFAGEKGKEYFDSIHAAEWNKTVGITENFILTKIKDDLIGYNLSDYYDLIYFDAFAPGKQPEMWEEPVLRKIAEKTSSGGIFVTYSSKGTVKRILRSCGFEVDLLPGPPGKREMIRAVKL